MMSLIPDWDLSSHLSSSSLFSQSGLYFLWSVNNGAIPGRLLMKQSFFIFCLHYTEGKSKTFHHLHKNYSGQPRIGRSAE